MATYYYSYVNLSKVCICMIIAKQLAADWFKHYIARVSLGKWQTKFTNVKQLLRKENGIVAVRNFELVSLPNMEHFGQFQLKMNT